eukprot:COSAG05_NODE_13104_length_441_cov_1.532164_1_plen_63_part_10
MHGAVQLPPPRPNTLLTQAKVEDIATLIQDVWEAKAAKVAKEAEEAAKEAAEAAAKEAAEEVA